MEWAHFIASVCIFAAASGFVLWRSEFSARKKAEGECGRLRGDMEIARAEAAKDSARAEAAERAEARLREDNAAMHKREAESAARLAAAETKLKNADKTVEALTEVRASMKDQFKDLSETVLEEKGRKFGDESAKILSPLKEDLEKFRAQASAIHAKDAADRSALKQQIESLQSNAAAYGKSADNLARALKSDSKTQGDWGEIALATLLQKSGLREGEEYAAQKSGRDEDGNLLRPDVVVNLPGGAGAGERHLIIDSKVSLRDYHDSSAAEPNSEAERAALARHLAAVKKHAADLSARHYSGMKNLNAPDFVFMFMPVEAAFFAALRTDANLFSFAYDRKIILCAPTTLMAVLRTVEHVWRLERQNRNAEEIARQAGNLYDKIVLFKNSVEDIGGALEKAGASFDRAKKQLSEGSGNLISRANKLRDLGANAKKPRLPEAE